MVITNNDRNDEEKEEKNNLGEEIEISDKKEEGFNFEEKDSHIHSHASNETSIKFLNEKPVNNYNIFFFF